MAAVCAGSEGSEGSAGSASGGWLDDDDNGPGAASGWTPPLLAASGPKKKRISACSTSLSWAGVTAPGCGGRHVGSRVSSW